MFSSRMIVVEGPEVGEEFRIPDEGGGIGRAEGNVVRLSDLSVSRSHCAIEQRDGRLVLVDPGSRNNTLVNGQVVTEHLLVEGDEITIGKSRLAFLPLSGPTPLLLAAGEGRITREVATQHLLPAFGSNAQDRASRHLGALSRLGEGLRGAADAAGVARAACEAVREALSAHRALLLLRDETAALSTIGASVDGRDALGDRLCVARPVLDKLMLDRKAVAIEVAEGSRLSLAVPIDRGEAEAAGILYADRPAGAEGAPAWDELDLKLLACAANVVGAALAGIAARDALARENQAFEERSGTSKEFIGKSAAAQAILAFTAKVGRADSTVLILGDSGAGKELVASAIHRASRRARGPFVCVNCAALSESVLESELFGHEKGAFTGATERKIGRFEMADSGTLFLDEVGEISLKCQAKFLRVLEERRFERVGGTRAVTVDVRVVAATNRDLEEMMRRGEFREDLYFRLSVIKTSVPPLRARADDIPLIAEHFLSRLRFQTGRRVTGFTPEAARALTATRSLAGPLVQAPIRRSGPLTTSAPRAPPRRTTLSQWTKTAHRTRPAGPSARVRSRRR
jgi:MoxR-like ATPase